MREFAQRLWAGLDGAAECEFVAAFAKPYPSLTIAAVLGAPQRDAPRLHEWSTWVQRQFDIRALGTEPERIERAAEELYDYVEQLLELRRREPSDDLISTLLKAEEEGDRLSPAECVNLVLNVLAGGVDTTVAQLAHGLLAVRQAPGPVGAARPPPRACSPGGGRSAQVRADHPVHGADLHRPARASGVIFPAWTIVAICAERANREIDDGNDFDISAERAGERALTFGAGPHFCLGQNLARAELEEALSFLAPRMPGLRAAGPAQLGNVEGIYGMESLPLAWS